MAVNDFGDPGEMTSFHVYVLDGRSHSSWTYYEDPTATALVRESETTFDGAKRTQLYRKIQAIVAHDIPFVALDCPRTSTPGGRASTISPSTPVAPTAWRTSGLADGRAGNCACGVDARYPETAESKERSRRGKRASWMPRGQLSKMDSWPLKETRQRGLGYVVEPCRQTGPVTVEGENDP